MSKAQQRRRFASNVAHYLAVFRLTREGVLRPYPELIGQYQDGQA